MHNICIYIYIYMHNHHHHHHHHHTHPRPSISPHEANSPNSPELALRNPAPVLLPENPVSLPVATGQKRTLIQSWCSSLTATKVIQSHPKSSDQQIALGKIYRIDQLTMVKWPAFWRYPKRSKESHGTCISAVCISAARCSSWRIPSSTCEIQKWPQLSLNVSKYLVNIIKYLVIDITKWFSSVPFKAVGPGFFTFDTQSHGDICYSRCQWIWLQE